MFAIWNAVELKYIFYEFGSFAHAKQNYPSNVIILSSSCHETFSGKNNRMSQKCKFLTTDLNEKNLFPPDIYSHAINQELWLLFLVSLVRFLSSFEE